MFQIGHIRVGDNDYKIEPKSHEAKLVPKVKHVVYKVDKTGEKGPDFTGDTNSFTVGKCRYTTLSIFTFVLNIGPIYAYFTTLGLVLLCSYK